MSEDQIVDIVRGVPIETIRSMAGIPDALKAKVEAMMTVGATTVDIASVLNNEGYFLVVMPDEDQLYAPDEDSAIGPGEGMPVVISYDAHEDDEMHEYEMDGYEEDEYEEEQPTGLAGLLDRLRAVFGKAVSFEQENKMISRNRKRAAARQPHTFQRAMWATRKGTIRCRICGGGMPAEGVLCAGATVKGMGEYGEYDEYEEYDKYGMEHGSMVEVGDLTLRSAALAETYDMISGTLGYWSQHDAHYKVENPFREEGLACLNCVAYQAESQMCCWVEGQILPDALCKLWVIPDQLRKAAPVTKEIVEVDGRFEVRSKDGSRSFGTYDTRAEAQERLAQVEQFSKADTYTPPDGVMAEAARAERWIAEGHAGPGFTPTGRRRAADLAAGNPVSLDTIKRMASYLARHQVDKQGEGWSPGEPGYPSPGRVAWAAWGGDAAVSWTRGILDSVDKGQPGINSVHVDSPMGSGMGRRKLPMPAFYKAIEVGSFVSWNSSGGRARGRVERISSDRPIRVPGTSFTIDASEDDPAVLIRLYEETTEGPRPTDRQVGHRMSTLTQIDALKQAVEMATCPVATRDVAVNLRNREKAIDTAAYGPLNPAEPNLDFWNKKAERWSVTISEAKKARCGNCAAFIQTSEMNQCIADGLADGDTDTDAWGTVTAGDLGYCESFDFKCAASRTCDAWIAGGPVTDSVQNGVAGIFAKAEERRFTLGPWYVPDSYDAHGEWTGAEDLQSALWGYVRNGDRQIRLQHNVDVVAGEWVEALTWPYAVNVPMLDVETGKVAEQEFPPNTVFMGVIWEEWAWNLVKQGKIRGYSMGGAGQRVEVDLPMEGQL